METDRSKRRERGSSAGVKEALPEARASAGRPLGPEQCRMARAALRMTVDELAERAGVSHATISRLENDLRCAPAEDALARIRTALEARGIVFLDGDSPGVRLGVL
jgi:DNA-binding XRE family transcriptional regulator